MLDADYKIYIISINLKDLNKKINILIITTKLNRKFSIILLLNTLYLCFMPFFSFIFGNKKNNFQLCL